MDGMDLSKKGRRSDLNAWHIIALRLYRLATLGPPSVFIGPLSQYTSRHKFRRINNENFTLSLCLHGGYILILKARCHLELKVGGSNIVQGSLHIWLTRLTPGVCDILVRQINNSWSLGLSSNDSVFLGW